MYVSLLCIRYVCLSLMHAICMSPSHACDVYVSLLCIRYVCLPLAYVLLSLFSLLSLPRALLEAFARPLARLFAHTPTLALICNVCLLCLCLCVRARAHARVHLCVCVCMWACLHIRGCTGAGPPGRLGSGRQPAQGCHLYRPSGHLCLCAHIHMRMWACVGLNSLFNCLLASLLACVCVRACASCVYALIYNVSCVCVCVCACVYVCVCVCVCMTWRTQGDKWPKNNGFLRILPLMGYHRVLFPQAGDVVVYTIGYVTERSVSLSVSLSMSLTHLPPSCQTLSTCLSLLPPHLSTSPSLYLFLSPAPPRCPSSSVSLALARRDGHTQESSGRTRGPRPLDT